MRNLLEYPITDEEKVTALENALDSYQVQYADRIGDINPYAIQLVIDEIRKTTQIR